MFVIIGLLVAFALILILRPWDRRACRWREDRRHGGAQTRYVCAACGAVALTDGAAPRRCRAADADGGGS